MSAPSRAPAVPWDTPAHLRPGERPQPQTRLEMLRTMVLARTFEEVVRREYHADKGPGFDIGKGLVPGEMHLAAGQEPVAAGVCAHLSGDDAVTATHRPHHVAIAHGVDLDAMTAEVFGRETGLGRGRGGHMHLFDPAVHFSCSGIVAEGIPPALGQAFAFRARGTDRVAVALTGDGAVNQGAFHESLNLAALWQLPVVVVVEDNDWGISVPRSASTAGAAAGRTPAQVLQARGAAYGMPAERVENDVEQVWAAAGRAVARARSGGGPSLLEVHTVRLWGHFEGDPQTYRTDTADLDQRDPLPAYERRLRADGLLDDTALTAVRQEARERVELAVDRARRAPLPDPHDAAAHVFCSPWAVPAARWTTEPTIEPTIEPTSRPTSGPTPGPTPEGGAL